MCFLCDLAQTHLEVEKRCPMGFDCSRFICSLLFCSLSVFVVFFYTLKGAFFKCQPRSVMITKETLFQASLQMFAME